MNKGSDSKQRSAFSWWLRTGTLPRVPSPDGLEVKFNLWHDPADGRFTFAGAGQSRGAGRSDSGRGAAGGSASPAAGKASGGRALAVARAPHRDARAKDVRRAAERTTSIRSGHSAKLRGGDRPNPVAEFAGGVGQGLYGAADGAVKSIHAALTTNPIITLRETNSGIAERIDAAIIGEDIPARVQLTRAADAIAQASARDIGRATGFVAGNAALAIAPEAAFSKVAALRRLRTARPRPTFDPPQIGWVKEKLNADKPWRPYNDAATGARPDQAPTLIRTMPDGSKRPVKFDGVHADYVVDRKWKVVDAPHSRAQLLRQADVLEQHRLIGLWEVPNALQKKKALKFLKKMNVTNIHVRIVEP